MIEALAETIKNIVGFNGKIIWDTSKLDGTPRKLLDIRKLLSLGWKAKINLEMGIQETYSQYRMNETNAEDIA